MAIVISSLTGPARVYVDVGAKCTHHQASLGETLGEKNTLQMVEGSECVLSGSFPSDTVEVKVIQLSVRAKRSGEFTKDNADEHDCASNTIPSYVVKSPVAEEITFIAKLAIPLDKWTANRKR